MKNNKKIIVVIIVILAVGVFLYYSFGSMSSLENDEVKGSLEKDAMTLQGYEGKALAGTESTPYLEFNQGDYEKALSQDKTILLYFYASWCPICRAEQPETFAAFDELNNDKVIGFRVNYKDSATDDYEENLAKEFGIPYQHTKVIIHGGEQALKSLEEWNKDKYLEELNKFS